MIFSERHIASRLCLMLSCLPIMGLSQQPVPERHEPQHVPYCRAATHPAKYDHHVFKTDGIYRRGGEIMSFYSLSCAKNEQTSWVDYSHDFRKLTSAKLVQRMDSILDKDGRARVVAVLEFDGPKPVLIPSGTAESLTRLMRQTNSRYGHGNQFRSRVLLRKIISVEPVPASSPWPTE